MKKALSLVLILIISISALLLCSCQKDPTSDMSYWSVTEKVSGTVNLQNYAVLKLTAPTDTQAETNNISQVMVNANNVNDYVSLELAFANTSSLTSIKLNETYVARCLDDQENTWISLVSGLEDAVYTYVEVCITQTINLNEIVFLNDAGDKFSVELIRAGIRPKRGSNSGSEWTKTELSSLVASGELVNTALNIIDEQDKFTN